MKFGQIFMAVDFHCSYKYSTQVAAGLIKKAKSLLDRSCSLKKRKTQTNEPPMTWVKAWNCGGGEINRALSVGIDGT